MKTLWTNNKHMTSQKSIQWLIEVINIQNIRAYPASTPTHSEVQKLKIEKEQNTLIGNF